MFGFVRFENRQPPGVGRCRSGFEGILVPHGLFHETKVHAGSVHLAVSISFLFFGIFEGSFHPRCPNFLASRKRRDLGGGGAARTNLLRNLSIWDGASAFFAFPDGAFFGLDPGERMHAVPSLVFNFFQEKWWKTNSY